MFGIFKGHYIKGVAFHQGFNNAMMTIICNPNGSSHFYSDW